MIPDSRNSSVRKSAFTPNRRDFMRLALAGFCVPSFSHLAWGEGLAYDRTSWYRKAKFGMFIHWGPYSQASVEASWPIMVPTPGGITEAAYRALPQTFNPIQFDPHTFVDLARLAGQEYMVFTTKHHDGFCMFDSSYTDYKITNTPYGKDIVKQLSKACEEDGMPLGFYYSPPDMHHPGFRDTTKLAKENWHGEPQRPEWESYLQYMQLELAELLTRYGSAAIIWFDGLNNQEKYNGARVVQMIHDLQPATLVNDRIGVDADYETPEQFIPTAIPTKGIVLTGIDPKVSEQLKNAIPRPDEFRLWETCMTINNTWAYNKNDRDFKSDQTLIRSLVEVASRGGNFLLNVGPQPNGEIQSAFANRLREMGAWLKIYGDSIYGTRGGPVKPGGWGVTTQRGNTIYVHVLDPSLSVLALRGIAKPVRDAHLMNGGANVNLGNSEGSVVLQLPKRASGEIDQVIVVETEE
jgi:alpha-L-fucosidase